MIQEKVKIWRTSITKLEDGRLAYLHPEEVTIPISEYNMFKWDRINRFDAGNTTVFVSKNREQLDAFWTGWTFRYEISKGLILRVYNN
jgi:hypothetical protein